MESFVVAMLAGDEVSARATIRQSAVQVKDASCWIHKLFLISHHEKNHPKKKLNSELLSCLASSASTRELFSN